MTSFTISCKRCSTHLVLFTYTEVFLGKELLVTKENLFHALILFKTIDPIPCDDCQMAWLLHENRNLLLNMQGTTCGSNMTMLEDLDPVFFTRCNEEPNSGANSNTLLALNSVCAALFLIIRTFMQ